MRNRGGSPTTVLALVAVLLACSSACSLSRQAIGAERDASERDLGIRDGGPSDAPVDDTGNEPDMGNDGGDDAGHDGGSDAGGPPQLDLFTGGTFTRASEASYLTGAPTDGSSAFLAWAPPDTRRIEDRGDGLGPMLLIEGSRTNFVIQSRAITDVTAWSSHGTASLSADAAPGPDMALVADRSSATHDFVYSPGQPLMGVAPNPHTISAYGRAATGASEWRTDYRIQAWSGPATTTWTRRDHTFATGGGTWFATNSFDATSGYDLFVDLHQLEDGVFPSSAIRTTTAAVTRAADALSFTGSALPELASAGFTITYAPDCSSDELLQSGISHPLLGSDTSNVLVLAPEGGAVRVVLVAQGTRTIGTASALTFSRAQRMTFVVRPSAGSITVAGASTGDGTIAGTGTPLAGTTFFVGSDGVDTAFGRFGRFVTIP